MGGRLKSLKRSRLDAALDVYLETYIEGAARRSEERACTSKNAVVQEATVF
jgi:hypothetical protein